MLAVLALVAAYLPIALAVSLQYSLMAQEPPVARVGEQFIFAILPSTFTTTSTVNYSTSSLPTWLSWSTPSLAFYGTPAATDLGQQVITLIATDSASLVNSSFSLVVSDSSVPAVHSAFTTQIANPPLREFSSATALPNGTGISIPPYWSFSLGFASDTFRLSRQRNNGRLYYKTHLRGQVGLPDWLTFDNTTYTFNGVAPASGTYTIVATGTDYWGYTGAQTSFVIEVGTGAGIELARGNLTDVIFMAGNDVAYEVDLGGVMMGGKSVAAKDLVLSLDNTDYSWLTLQG
jgi:axial budding pattern protein 2